MKFTFVTLILALAALNFSSCSKKSRGDEPPPASGDLRFAVFGDSLAAGLFADTVIGQSLPDDTAAEFTQFIEAYLADRQAPDSYFKSLDSSFAAHDSTAFGGNAAYSLPIRLQTKLGRSVFRQIYALSASTAESMESQVASMKEDVAEWGGYDVIVIHVGGNDWCAKRERALYQADLKRHVEIIAKDNPNARIVLMPVPNLVTVLATPDQVGFTVTALGETKNFQCQKIRSTLKTCEGRPITMGTAADALAADIADVKIYNEAVQSVADHLKESVPEFKGQIKVASEYGEPFAANWLAVDCFHPGTAGQEEISKLAWPALESMY